MHGVWQCLYACPPLLSPPLLSPPLLMCPTAASHLPRYHARIIVPRPTSSATVLDTHSVGNAEDAAARRWSAAGAAEAATAAVASAAHALAIRAVVPSAHGPAAHAPGRASGYDAGAAAAGCPFHRALSGGSSLLERLGVPGGSRPASSGLPASGSGEAWKWLQNVSMGCPQLGSAQQQPAVQPACLLCMVHRPERSFLFTQAAPSTTTPALCWQA